MRTDLYRDLYLTEETHWWHKAKNSYVNLLISLYIIKRNLSILDVGCGTGKNMENMGKWGVVCGVDVSDEAISFCKRRNLTKVKKGGAEKIPFVKESFDMVCALDVLEHVDDRSSMKEIYRVLKNNGHVIITVPAFRFLWSKWDEALHHKRRYTKEQLAKILTAEGFVIKKNTYIHSFLIIPVIIVRYIKQLNQKPYSSDFQMNNGFTNTFLSFISKLEQWWIKRYDMPFGTSVLCIAQKKEPQFLS